MSTSCVSTSMAVSTLLLRCLSRREEDGARPIAVEVTAAGNTRRSRLAVRQNNGDDGTLYSPSETSSVAAGSSFNLTYRCEDSDTRIVLVGLVRAYTVSRFPARLTVRYAMLISRACMEARSLRSLARCLLSQAKSPSLTTWPTVITVCRATSLCYFDD